MQANVIRRSRIRNASVRATVFNVSRGDDSTSRQIVFTDEFLSIASMHGATIVLPTPYRVSRLFEIIDQSNMLRQCIDAYVTNTVLTGYEVAPILRNKIVNEGEQVELESFLEHANSEESMSTILEKIIRDRESVGFGYMEVIPDRIGLPSLLRWCPSLYTRLCAKDPTEILVEYTILRGRRVTTVREYRRFRRYLQMVNGQQVWFKEFGDPRKMDYSNGAFEGQSGYDASKQATSLMHFKKPSNDAYGVPVWINQLPSILGSREAEEVNMRYFEDNTVPPMMLLVGNGRLTAQSYQSLTNALNNPNEVGKKRQNQIMLLEAVGDGDSLDGKNSAIELKVEKLTDQRQSDGLFRSYDEANMAKVRSSFRLPPVVVGMSQDVNFATAATSAFVAESQVFAPEREKLEQFLNKQLINGKNGLGLTTCKLVSRSPAITSPEMLIKSLTALNVMGAVTPRQAQKAANKILQTELDPYPEKGEEGYEEWMDLPLVISNQKASEKAAELAADQAKTDAEQALKDAETKAVEKNGDVSKKQPKNGQQ